MAMGDAGTDGGRATMEHQPATTGIKTHIESDDERGQGMQGPTAAEQSGQGQ